jgi:hypothetical protein
LPRERRAGIMHDMPKRSSKKPVQAEQPAVEPADAAPEEKNPAAVQLGRLGGKKGGIARAKKLTAEQRSAIARKAAQARWRKPEVG